MPLEQIQYIDYPEILINEHERTEMPFRYVKGDDGEPIMPKVRPGRTSHPQRHQFSSHDITDKSQGMVDLIKKDADQGIDDLV